MQHGKNLLSWDEYFHINSLIFFATSLSLSFPHLLHKFVYVFTWKIMQANGIKVFNLVYRQVRLKRVLKIDLLDFFWNICGIFWGIHKFLMESWNFDCKLNSISSISKIKWYPHIFTLKWNKSHKQKLFLMVTYSIYLEENSSISQKVREIK